MAVAVEMGPDGRTLIENGRLVTVRGAAAARVLITRRLRRMRGELFSSPDTGMRLVKAKQQRPVNFAAFEVDVASNALQIEGVREAVAKAELLPGREIQVTLTARWVSPTDPRETEPLEIVEVL